MAYNLLINGIYWGYNPLTNQFQRHQESKKDSTLLMNSDHWNFWTMNWAGLPDFALVVYQELGEALEKNTGFLLNSTILLGFFLQVPNFKTT